jgi:hypothetical protein
MKRFHFLLMAAAILVGGALRGSAQGTLAPLTLLINGGGTVYPLTNGQPLEVGQTYSMIAIPDAGFAFSSWQPANVFTFTTTTINPDGSTNPPVVSVVTSLVPTYTNQASLEFTMQPVMVLSSTPSVTITEGTGWQANFAPVILNIQLNGSSVILTWTNLTYNLQAAPTPFSAFTNVPSATSPYTNSIAGPALYFRLVSN